MADDNRRLSPHHMMTPKRSSSLSSLLLESNQTWSVSQLFIRLMEFLVSSQFYKLNGHCSSCRTSSIYENILGLQCRLCRISRNLERVEQCHTHRALNNRGTG